MTNIIKKIMSVVLFSLLIIFKLIKQAALVNSMLFLKTLKIILKIVELLAQCE